MNIDPYKSNILYKYKKLRKNRTTSEEKKKNCIIYISNASILMCTEIYF
jgi:hypothetical protein